MRLVSRFAQFGISQSPEGNTSRVRMATDSCIAKLTNPELKAVEIRAVGVYCVATNEYSSLPTIITNNWFHILHLK